MRQLSRVPMVAPMGQLKQFWAAVAVIVIAGVVGRWVLHRDIAWGSLADWCAAFGSIFAALVALHLAGEPARQHRLQELQTLDEALDLVDALLAHARWTSVYKPNVGPHIDDLSLHNMGVEGLTVLFRDFPVDQLTPAGRKAWRFLEAPARTLLNMIGAAPDTPLPPENLVQWQGNIHDLYVTVERYRRDLQASRAG